ncbi:hypothetical protein O181_007807 [Austropuccinia psidii MF-1]|uniref:Uncharacterized protein n=1 Tax=Austropuccinia psidii MF-1 TaxID=1389203 RepID=A0A9Q3BNJ3_9BASI|nr:hypothetical protein [Austropuccinia psidii MF-1]
MVSIGVRVADDVLYLGCLTLCQVARARSTFRHLLQKMNQFSHTRIVKPAARPRKRGEPPWDSHLGIGDRASTLVILHRGSNGNGTQGRLDPAKVPKWREAQ